MPIITKLGLEQLNCDNLMGKNPAVLPSLGYIGMCGPKGYDSLAVLIKDRVSNLSISVSNRVCFFV